MPARDDFGSGAGRPGGYGGGAGGLGNGGIGGGMGGGFGGGGAGINGGIGSRTGMTTGNTMYGNTAFGRPGGMVQAYGTKLTNGMMVDPRLPNGARPRPVGPTPTSAPPVMGRPPAQKPAMPPSVPSWAQTVMSMPNYMPNFMSPIQGPNFLNNPSRAPSPTYDPNVITGGTYPNPTLSAKPYTDQVPQDPSFPGNTFDNTTGHVGYSGSSIRGWGGWNDPFR